MRRWSTPASTTTTACRGASLTDLGIAPPEIDLGVGSLPPSEQVGEIMRRFAGALGRQDADAVIVRGDTNSTIAGALVAKQHLLPSVYIEAGMRSYDWTAPEEINRLAVDHISDLCLTTDAAAAARLRAEGVAADAIAVCGDVMYDVFLETAATAAQRLRPDLAALTLEPFVLLTLHRSENVDDPRRLRAILDGFAAAPVPVVFPVHPRTAARLREFAFALPQRIVACEPLDTSRWSRSKRARVRSSPTRAACSAKPISRAFLASRCATRRNGPTRSRRAGTAWPVRRRTRSGLIW